MPYPHDIGGEVGGGQADQLLHGRSVAAGLLDHGELALLQGEDRPDLEQRSQHAAQLADPAPLDDILDRLQGDIEMDSPAHVMDELDDLLKGRPLPGRARRRQNHHALPQREAVRIDHGDLARRELPAGQDSRLERRTVRRREGDADDPLSRLHKGPKGLGESAHGRRGCRRPGHGAFGQELGHGDGAVGNRLHAEMNEEGDDGDVHVGQLPHLGGRQITTAIAHETYRHCSILCAEGRVPP